MSYNYMEYNLGNVFKSVMRLEHNRLPVSFANSKQLPLCSSGQVCIHSDIHTFLIRKVLT